MDTKNDISFSEGIDLSLDVSSAVGGKVLDIKVSDVSPGVLDLHVEIGLTIPSDYAISKIVVV